MTDTNSIIDSVMGDATAAPEAPSVDDNQEVIEQDLDVNEEDAVTEEAAEDESADDVDQTLDKLKKSNKKKLNYIRNLQEREKSLLSQINELKSQVIEPKQFNQDDFDGSYGEFIKKQAIEEMRAELGLNQQKEQLNQLSLQQQQLKEERVKVLEEEVTSYAKQSKDFAEVVSSNSDKFDALPENVENLFYELENPTLAAYALAKEGKIEQLAYMSPYMAAAEIYQAQIRGQQYLQASSKKQVSNAPLPVNAVKGTAKTGVARLSEKGPDELYKWLQT